MGVCQEHGNRLWVAVHNRFFARPIVNTQHADTLVLELDLVMPRINFHWVFSGWLGHSCGCHVSSFDLMRCCRTQKERVRLGLLSSVFKARHSTVGKTGRLVELPKMTEG